MFCNTLRLAFACCVENTDWFHTFSPFQGLVGEVCTLVAIRFGAQHNDVPPDQMDPHRKKALAQIDNLARSEHGALGFADPASDIGYAYVTSQMGVCLTGDPRRVLLVSN